MLRLRILAVSVSLFATECITEPKPAVVLTVAAPDLGMPHASADTFVRWMVGTPDTIRITAMNTSDRAVTLHFPSGCQITPYVRNAAGQLIVPAGGGWVCTEVLTTLEFQPQESKTQSFVWSTDSLPPGPYSVYATFAATEGSQESNHVAVVLLSPLSAERRARPSAPWSRIRG